MRTTVEMDVTNILINLTAMVFAAIAIVGTFRRRGALVVVGVCGMFLAIFLLWLAHL